MDPRDLQCLRSSLAFRNYLISSHLVEFRALLILRALLRFVQLSSLGSPLFPISSDAEVALAILQLTLSRLDLPLVWLGLEMLPFPSSILCPKSW